MSTAHKFWELKRSSKYGSDHYNEKEKKLIGAKLAEDEKTLKLGIRDMSQVWQMEILFKIKDKNGLETEGKIHSTIHNLGT